MRNIEARFEDFPAPLPAGCANRSRSKAKGGWEFAVMVKTTRITIESDSQMVVHRAQTAVTWCPACCSEVEAMALKGDGLDDGIPAALLEGWLGSGMLHLWRHADGSAQVCLPSLLQCFKAGPVPRLGTPKNDRKTGDEP